MRDFYRVSLKLGAILLATIVTFFVGAYAGGAFCVHWVVPGWVKQYPNDGQLGLGVMEYAIVGGLIASGVVFAAGILLMVWTAQNQESATETSDLADETPIGLGNIEAEPGEE